MHRLNIDLYYNNFKNDAIDNNVWHGGWTYTFVGLGFKSYRFFGDHHYLSDDDHTLFVLRYS